MKITFWNFSFNWAWLKENKEIFIKNLQPFNVWSVVKNILVQRWQVTEFFFHFAYVFGLW